MKRLLCVIFLFFTFGASAQHTAARSFFELTGPERRWVISHPFVAKKAFKIAHESRSMAGEIKKDTLLWGRGNSGQVDAFRHSYWMARLTQEIGERRAESLGVAHEKGNQRDFEQGRMEEGFVPDATSVRMDLINNKKGIEVGKNHPGLDRESIKRILIQKIKNGEMVVIRQDEKGRFLNEDNEVIPAVEWQNKWENERNIVPSDFTPKRIE